MKTTSTTHKIITLITALSVSFGLLAFFSQTAFIVPVQADSQDDDGAGGGGGGGGCSNANDNDCDGVLACTGSCDPFDDNIDPYEFDRDADDNDPNVGSFIDGF